MSGNVFYYMDNAKPHISKETKEFIYKEKLKVIYSAPYMPEYNPCENIFSILKNTVFRRLHKNQ